MYFYDGREFSEEELDNVIRPIKTGEGVRESRIANTLPLIEGPTVLDVGCGAGFFSYLIAKKHPSWKITGIDLLEDSINIAKEKLCLPNTHYETRNLLKKRFKPNSFDCILFLETIEHVDEPGVFLKEFHGLLKPNGCLVLSTPNAVSFQNIVRHFGQSINRRLAAIKNEPRHTGTHLEHVAAYDVFVLTRLLDRNGFKYEKHNYARFSVPLSRSKWINLGFMESVAKPLCDDVIIKARKTRPRL
ncbi:class I SAM-dependent methyltransferase [Candidatus Micrarchaeota archaeon]|nr:class I SAM-dependent methyltransferase [Candidatus Micrarchaeota archaeon]